MEAYTCPHCHRTSYTAGSIDTHQCPFCQVQQVIVARDFAPARQKIAEAFKYWPDAIVVLDRRFENRRSRTEAVAEERRSSDRRTGRGTCAVTVSPGDSIPPPPA